MDGLYPYGRVLDVVVTGADRTTLWPLVQEAARRSNLQITGDPEPEQGSYYRSDHFSFAHVGIPAFSIEEGWSVAGKPPGYGEQVSHAYNEKNYHQPSDEYHADWDFSGLEQLAHFGMLLGVNTANLDTLPAWNPGDEFQRVR
jgi:Zn-dependent M28 family amino/carboxypeptidase